MTKLEKSIRHEMKFYGPKLRNGHYGTSDTTGIVPSDYRVLSCACCDAEDGIVTDIRLYAYGDAFEREDYYGQSIDITDPVIEYLRNMIAWDEMIYGIADIVKSEIVAED